MQFLAQLNVPNIRMPAHPKLNAIYHWS